MKAMILAAGRGERLRPLTDTVPKPMVEVNKQPLIVYHIKRLAKMGITDIVINHAWLGDKLVAFLGDGQRYGVKIQYSAESIALETGGGIKQALALLGHDPFLVLNGDVFIEGELTLPQLAPNNLAHLCWWLIHRSIRWVILHFVKVSYRRVAMIAILIRGWRFSIPTSLMIVLMVHFL